jgi:hypothetical protein
MVTAAAAAAWARGRLLDVYWSDVLLWTAAAIAVVLLARNVDAALRVVVRGFWPTLLAMWPFMGAALLGLAVRRRLPDPLLSVPASAVAAAGALTLVVPALIAHLRLREPEPDVLVAPLDDPDDVRRRNRRAAVAALWILPAFGLMSAALNVALALLVVP